MSNTYTKIHLQFVFAVKFRTGLIQPSWQDEVYKYITGIVQKQGHKILAINGMPDHVHLFVGMRPMQSISDLMQDVKADSSQWINKSDFVNGRFEWQEGYGAFSYGASQVPDVIAYVRNQKEHHAKRTFLEEYREFLEKFGVDFDERYIFKEPV